MEKSVDIVIDHVRLDGTMRIDGVGPRESLLLDIRVIANVKS